ncbi:MAG: site-2 protease family protein [Ignavibacteriales bacterium]|nr:site-2 protease family protein [Ignavibacteriales bacterium]
MSNNFPQEDPLRLDEVESAKPDFRFLLNILLLLLTLFTTTVAGVQWVGKNAFELTNLHYGLPYSISILFVLGVHEFGHYFAARYHGVKVTLPYFLPFPPTPFFLNFGTLGALIRTRSVVPTRKAMFDIGVAGPLAGFCACVVVLILGFLTLPGPDYILSIHPGYDFSTQMTNDGQGLGLEFGRTILYSALSWLLTDPAQQFVPPMSEMYHYPLLCVGWFGLFVTAMNLIPIGQYDGGHLIYTLFGDKHRRIARTSFVILLVLGLPAVIDALLRGIMSYFMEQLPAQIVPFAQYSWTGWFLWALVSYYFIKLYHPPVPDETPLDRQRIIVGWFTLIVFVVSFSFAPFTISM